jgi:hypothetical protein
METIRKLLDWCPNDDQLDAVLAYCGEWVLKRKAVLAAIAATVAVTPWNWDDAAWNLLVEIWKTVVAVFQ